jgi:hypothetical protein
MSYADSGDDRYVMVKLVEIRGIRDTLARLRQENNLNQVLWVQVAGLYQRLRAQPDLASQSTQDNKESQHGPSPASLPTDPIVH